MFDYKNPDYNSVFKLRLKNLQGIRDKPEDLPALIKYYSTHYADFIEDWMMTNDPRIIGRSKYMPFLLFPKQREFIDWLYEKTQIQEDGLVEKTRDSGFTYMCGAFAICEWLFNAGSKVGFGSRKEMLVDRSGDPDSIFYKIRFMINTLPDEFLPDDFDEKKHFAFMRIMNPANGSAITGEAGDNIGRGGRSSIYFKDESAFYERPKLIEAALSENTNVQIDISTVNGVGNPFFIKRHSGKVDVFIFDWRDDPRKDQAWYDKKVATKDPEIVAQEIDRDYFASTEGICIPAKYVRAAVNFADTLKERPSGMKICGFDPADDDETSDPKGVVIRKGIDVYFVEEWREGNVTESTRRVYGLCKDERVELLHYDSIGLGAGVKGEIKSIIELDKDSHYKLKARGINVGSTKFDKTEYYEPDKLCKDTFANLKAELYTKLSRRFRRTWEHVNGVKEHPIDDLISIPNDNKLISELSSFKTGHNEAGKIIIEKKAALKLRGVKSPNLAEALAVAMDKIQITTVEAISNTKVRIF